jgi:hypothetical protein
LAGGKVSGSRELFGSRFLVNVKRSHPGAFADRRRSVNDEFFVLGIILQGHIRLKEPIHELSFLVLGVKAGEAK